MFLHYTLLEYQNCDLLEQLPRINAPVLGHNSYTSSPFKRIIVLDNKHTISLKNISPIVPSKLNALSYFLHKEPLINMTNLYTQLLFFMSYWISTSPKLSYRISSRVPHGYLNNISIHICFDTI